MHPLNGALRGPYVLVRVSRVALNALLLRGSDRGTSQFHRTLISLSLSLWNDVANPVYVSVGLAGFKSWTNAFLLAKAALSHYSLLLIFPFSSFALLVGIVRLGSSD